MLISRFERGPGRLLHRHRRQAATDIKLVDVAVDVVDVDMINSIGGQTVAISTEIELTRRQYLAGVEVDLVQRTAVAESDNGFTVVFAKGETIIRIAGDVGTEAVQGDVAEVVDGKLGYSARIGLVEIASCRCQTFSQIIAWGIASPDDGARCRIDGGQHTSTEVVLDQETIVHGQFAWCDRIGSRARLDDLTRGQIKKLQVARSKVGLPELGSARDELFAVQLAGGDTERHTRTAAVEGRQVVGLADGTDGIGTLGRDGLGGRDAHQDDTGQ